MLGLPMLFALGQLLIKVLCFSDNFFEKYAKFLLEHPDVAQFMDFLNGCWWVFLLVILWFIQDDIFLHREKLNKLLPDMKEPTQKENPTEKDHKCQGPNNN